MNTASLDLSMSIDMYRHPVLFYCLATAIPWTSWFAAAYVSHLTPTNQLVAVAVSFLGIVGLTVLSRLGIRAFNGLPVTSFALSGDAQTYLTPTYLFALAANFQPQPNYEANIKAVHHPLAVVAGAR